MHVMMMKMLLRVCWCN